MIGWPVSCASRSGNTYDEQLGVAAGYSKQEHVLGVRCCGDSVWTLVSPATGVSVMSGSVPCSCIGVFGFAVARPERWSAGHATGASVGGMVAIQQVDAADGRSRHAACKASDTPRPSGRAHS